MQAPADPDHEIKSLLADQDPAKRIAGLELLDKKYRKEITGYIRYLKEVGSVKLISHEPPDIWPLTLISVITNVETGKFDYEGDLRAYLRTIAYCRAIDQDRKDPRFGSTGFSDYQLEGSQVQNDENEIMELTADKVRKLKHEVRKLKPTLRIVMETDIDLLLKEDNWPSIKKLTSEVNRLFPEESLSENAVRGGARGRKELRRLLGSDLFDEPEDSDDLENSNGPDDSIHVEDSHGREDSEEPKDSEGGT